MPYFAMPLITPGLTVYAMIRPHGTASLWNGTAFVDYVQANWQTYAISATEGPSGIYIGQWPTGIAEGLYDIPAYIRAGATPASTDTLRGQDSHYLTTTAGEPDVPIFSAAWKLLSPASVDDVNETLFLRANGESAVLAFDLTMLLEIIAGQTVISLSLDAVDGLTISDEWASRGYCGATFTGEASETAYSITGQAVLSGGRVVGLNRKLLIS